MHLPHHEQTQSRPLVVFGPEMPGWGSWDWVGADLLREISRYYRTQQFSSSGIPAADVLVIVKHALPFEIIEQVSSRSKIIYCPVDSYGSSAEIDADARMLRKCSRILVHCERLRRYFEPYAPVEFMDHHVKFATMMSRSFRKQGFLLWVGVRTNLPPLVEWINAHPLPYELHVVTNLENPQALPHPEHFGFQKNADIHIRNWSKTLHADLARKAKAVLDIKGKDFRSNHKPPAKAIDFLVSGVPLAMNPDSSPVEHLARLGFTIADPLDLSYWLSKTYWKETQRFGKAIGELLTLKRIGFRWKRIIDDVLAERRS